VTNNDPRHVGPKIDPGWFDVARQLILFFLGVWLIIYAATTQGHDVPFLATGLILFGMVPFERLVDRWSKGEPAEREHREAGGDEHEVDRDRLGE